MITNKYSLWYYALTGVVWLCFIQCDLKAFRCPEIILRLTMYFSFITWHGGGSKIKSKFWQPDRRKERIMRLLQKLWSFIHIVIFLFTLILRFSFASVEPNTVCKKILYCDLAINWNLFVLVGFRGCLGKAFPENLLKSLVMVNCEVFCKTIL